MTQTLTIALAQTTQSVGDLSGNADAMLEWRAKAQDADLIVFPELQLIGYPPEDLVLKPALIERAGDELLRLAKATGDGQIARDSVDHLARYVELLFQPARSAPLVHHDTMEQPR